MKRIRVAAGKYVTISDELAEKAARVFASGALTRDQVRDLKASEPRLASGVMLGATKPLNIAKSRVKARRDVNDAAQSSEGWHPSDPVSSKAKGP